MTFRNLLRPALAAAALFGAGPAFAGEAQCLWNALSPATQDALLASYARSGEAGVAEFKHEPAESRRQVRQCAELGGVVDPKRAVRAMGVALQGFVMRQGAVRALRSAGAHGEEQLQLAWSELGPQKRATLHARGEKMAETPAKLPAWGDEAAPVLTDFFASVDRISSMGRSDPQVQRALDGYVLGRALQEAAEPRF